jgi:hypothetical protein
LRLGVVGLGLGIYIRDDDKYQKVEAHRDGAEVRVRS